MGALAASTLFGPQVAGVFGALMALAIVSTVNAMITIGPRLAFPLVPASYLLIGAWMIDYGFMLRPAISAAAVITLITGAAVYYARLRTGSTGGELAT